tara:strand:- start:920 stop:1129 length:210 start_codon:yes stop_codon:yes gene_type:complete
MNNADKPAMPSPHFEDDELQGLTKREHFAGLAMQGIMANDQQYLTWSDLAKDSVAVADALLKQLEQDND